MIQCDPGLQNASVVRQRSDIAACHGLYNVVFAALGLSKVYSLFKRVLRTFTTMLWMNFASSGMVLETPRSTM